MSEREALKHEINLVLTDPDTNLSHGARRALDYVIGQLEALAQPEQEPTNLERHERNVQKFLGTQQPKEPEQEPVAHVCVFPLRGDEFFPQTRIEWKNGRPVAGPLYTTPPQRKPLTFEQRMRICNECGDSVTLAILLTEDAHGIKGEA